MKASDAERRDRAMYYNGTYMTHSTKGVVHVNVNDQLELRATVRGGRRSTVAATDLTPFWIRPGAYNLQENGGGIYLGRRGRRVARRSASADAYRVLVGRASLTNETLWSIINGTYDRTNLHEAIELIREGKQTSVAVSRNILATSAPDEQGAVQLWVRDQQAGIIAHTGLFVPRSYVGGTYKLIRSFLEQEGIQC